MAQSLEERALRRSNAVFKKGVDPATLVTTLYSNELLTPDEKSKATLKTLTDEQQLEEMFKAIERRVNSNPGDFHELVKALRTEPAMETVADKIQGIYDELKSKAKNGASSPTNASTSPTNGSTSPTNGTSPTKTSSTDQKAPGMQTPQKQELIDHVKITDWQRFGLELKIDDRTLNLIDRDPALPRIQDKLREVFRILLDEMDKDLTWVDVVEALKVIKEKRLARDIEKDFCQ